ncbi:MAG TPA: hypothetical protein VHQ91_13985 [Geminicoccaceae bacterium]|nr:hypothetical protein [Geminicoccaceae bacterium]
MRPARRLALVLETFGKAVEVCREAVEQPLQERLLGLGRHVLEKQHELPGALRQVQAVGVAGREINDDLAAEGVAEQRHAGEIHRVQPGRERIGQNADVEHLVRMAAVAEPGQVGQEHPVGVSARQAASGSM